MVPTFIVAGATKSGTTALGEYLNDHPQVCMSWMKEPNFFTEEIPVTRYKNGFSWYQSLFDKKQTYTTYVAADRGSRFERDARLITWGLTNDESKEFCSYLINTIKKKFSGDVGCIEGFSG